LNPGEHTRLNEFIRAGYTLLAAGLASK